MKGCRYGDEVTDGEVSRVVDALHVVPFHELNWYFEVRYSKKTPRIVPSIVRPRSTVHDRPMFASVACANQAAPFHSRYCAAVVLLYGTRIRRLAVVEAFVSNTQEKYFPLELFPAVERLVFALHAAPVHRETPRLGVVRSL
jgi:hypothetical protein